MDPEIEAALRRRTGETGPDSRWQTEDFEPYLAEADGNLDLAAALVWDAKANAYAELVNTSESSSSRALGDLYKNATARGKEYRGYAAASGDVVAPTEAAQRARTFPIAR